MTIERGLELLEAGKLTEADAKNLRRAQIEAAGIRILTAAEAARLPGGPR